MRASDVRAAIGSMHEAIGRSLASPETYPYGCCLSSCLLFVPLLRVIEPEGAHYIVAGRVDGHRHAWIVSRYSSPDRTYVVDPATMTDVREFDVVSASVADRRGYVAQRQVGRDEEDRLRRLVRATDYGTQVGRHEFDALFRERLNGFPDSIWPQSESDRLRERDLEAPC